MENKRRIRRMVALLVCAMMLAPTAAPLVRAEQENLEIDVGDLYDNKDEDKDKDKDNPDETDKPDDSDKNNNTGNTGNSGNTGSTTRPSRPGSGNNHDSGSTGSNTGNTGNSGNTTGDNTTTEPEQKPETPSETDGQQAPDAQTVAFSDVTEADWYYNDVHALAEMGVIAGYPNGSFNPDGEVTNAEFIKLVVSLLCAETYTTNDYMFKDVPPDEWYSDYIATAVVYGFINIAKYGDTFSPDAPISRRSAAEILVNALKGEMQKAGIEVGKHETPYIDTADHNIIALFNACIMQGELDEQTGERSFRPDTGITRAETAAVIMRTCRFFDDADGYVKSFRETYNVAETKKLG